MRRAAALLVVGLSLAACHTVRPASLSQWDACIAGDAHPVLHLHVKWGDAAAYFGGEYEAAWLMAELPRDLATGTVIPFAAGRPEGSYLEGSEGLYFESHTLTGSIRVLRSDSSSAELALDLVAVSPSVDVEHRGAMPLRGTIRAARIRGSTGCP
jgi:hypothetical protein